jgi:DNA-binding NtrC family response regulator
MNKILIISSLPEVIDSLENSISRTDVETVISFDGSGGLALLQREGFDLAYVTLELPDMDGVDLVRDAQRFRIPTQFIIVAPRSKRVQAEAAVWEGAYDLLLMPTESPEVLLQLNRALRHNELLAENRNLRSELSNRFDFPMLTGASSEIRILHEKVVQASDSDMPVLITGEHGTGKSFIAKTIHYNSQRGHQPFVSINCASVPESLLESDMFGSERGAYSTSVQVRQGKFELARGGTIFLEDLDKLHSSLQAKVLKTITNGEYLRVGGRNPHALNARIISCTSQSPKEAVKHGALNKELLNAVCTVELNLPPLRKRKNDIPVILEHFMAETSKKLGQVIPKLSKEARDILLKHNWPDNIRELQSVAEHAVFINTTGILSPDDLPEYLRGNKRSKGSDSGGIEIELADDQPLELKKFISELEADIIFRALQKTAGNKSMAAKKLGLKRTTLIEKIKKLNILPQPPLT